MTEENKEVVVEEKNKLNAFFDSKAVKAVEGALLVGASVFAITYLGLPADIVGTAAIGLAGVLGLDGIVTFIAAITKKKEDKATEVN